MPCFVRALAARECATHTTVVAAVQEGELAGAYCAGFAVMEVGYPRNQRLFVLLALLRRGLLGSEEEKQVRSLAEPNLHCLCTLVGQAIGVADNFAASTARNGEVGVALHVPGRWLRRGIEVLALLGQYHQVGVVGIARAAAASESAAGSALART